jgi:hypothetical protein
MEMSLLGVPHLLSPEEPIFWGHLSYLFLSSGFTMGVGQSKIPSDSPLGCLLANLGPLCLMPDLCNQAWPQYPLDSASKWPFNGTFDPNSLSDLYNFCECTVKWKEIPYVQSFFYIRTKPSLITSCFPVQVLLASKPVSKPAKSSSEPPSDSKNFPSFDPC